jgi:hypothetical protein
VARGVEERRFDVRRTSRKDYRIQCAGELQQFGGSEAERDFDGFGAVCRDGAYVLVIGIALVAKFFFFSAIRDAYANFGGWGGAHEMPSYH